MRNGRRTPGHLACLAFLLLVPCPFPLFGQTAPSPNVFAAEPAHGPAIDAATRLLRAHRVSTGVPGMQVAVALEGQLIWSAGFGFRDLAAEAPVERTTRFQLGSTSKALTAVSLAVLAHQGIVDLREPIQRWVPSFPEKRWEVTPLHLVGHTAGVRHYEGGPGDVHRTEEYATMTEAALIIADDSLRYRPGTRMHYSSFGYNLLGAVIEGVTGDHFLASLNDLILQPLEMTHTGGAGLDPTEESTTYRRGPSGRVVAPEESFSYKWPAGGLASTAEDMTRFGSGLLRGAILPPPRVEELFTSLETEDGQATGYGFGFQLHTDGLGRRVVGHGGNAPTGRSHFLMYPDLGLVVSILANTGEGIFFNEGEALEIAGLFARSVDGLGGPASPLPPDLEGTWAFDVESPFGDGATVEAELDLYRSDGLTSGELRLTVGGNPRPFPVGLVEQTADGVRVITVGGSHLHLHLRFSDDRFEGTMSPSWVAPPPGMLRFAPDDVRRSMAERARPRAIKNGRRVSG